MNNVVSLMKNLNSGNPLPIIRDVIDFYLDFFQKTDSLFDLVERYAQTIIDLAGEVLSLIKNTSHPHSYVSMREKELSK